MTDLPRHPDASDAGGAAGHGPTAKKAWWPYAVAAIVVVLLVLMVVLHLAGVLGPGSH